MKYLAALLLLFTITVASAQKAKEVDLRWKLAEGEELKYGTVMKEIDSSTFELNFDRSLFPLSDTSKEDREKSKQLFKEFNEAFQNLDYITTLTSKEGGVVDIVMRTRPKDEVEIEDEQDSSKKEVDAMVRMMQKMSQGVMLRGSVYENGDIHSFWLKSGQKNLIAAFFQLPADPVKVGDKWPLEINFIANGQNFICDSSYKKNEVTLVDIQVIDGETIASLQYDIEEYVIGDVVAGSFFGAGSENNPKTMLNFTHQGLAEFSIDQGRWLTYDGIMGVKASGFMDADKKTKFTLLLEE